jgi:ribosomal protein S18 acetylase RimI-like enzyme
MTATRLVTTTLGPFTLRRERPEDGDFLFNLFKDHNARILRFGGLPEPTIEQLIAFQFQSQTKTYRGLYPDDAFSVVAFGGEDVGRIVEHDEGDVIYVADILFRVDCQGRGLGTALIGALKDEWAARGRGGRALVMSGNVPSLKMWRKLGFDGAPIADGSHLDMRWYPPGAAPRRRRKI